MQPGDASLAIGRRLRALRAERGWRQRDVAEHLGMPQNRVCEIERTPDDGHRLGTLRRFAVLYGVRLADLVAAGEGRQP